jgi:glycosyltransferase involved in cell wall biosynthesis
VRVSVIVPTRNRAESLVRTLAGVRAQSHGDVQLIVVDDGSSAEQSALNEQLVRSTSGSSCIRLQPTDPCGSGPSRARNAGIAAATGELIAFCDDDDHWCDPGWLETAVAAFAADPALGVFFGNQEAVAFGATQYATWQPKLDSAVVARSVEAGAVAAVSKAECFVSAGDFAHMNACVFRKTLLDAIGGFNADVRYCEDLDLYVRAVDRAGAVYYLRRTVAIHNVPDRSRHDNASTRLDERAKSLALHLIARRLAGACVSLAAADYCTRLGAQACRTLARDAAARSRGAEAITWARLAGTWRATVGWTVYTCFLKLRFAHQRLPGNPDRTRNDALDAELDPAGTPSRVQGPL